MKYSGISLKIGFIFTAILQNNSGKISQTTINNSSKFHWNFNILPMVFWPIFSMLFLWNSTEIFRHIFTREVKMYRTYREIPNLDQNFSLHAAKLLPVWELQAEPCCICQADLSILINWTSPFPNLGVSGVLFHFHSILNRNSCKQTV